MNECIRALDFNLTGRTKVKNIFTMVSLMAFTAIAMVSPFASASEFQKEKVYLKAVVGCHGEWNRTSDGSIVYSTVIDDGVARTAYAWRELARQRCRSRCNLSQTKCGVNSFAVVESSE